MTSMRKSACDTFSYPWRCDGIERAGNEQYRSVAFYRVKEARRDSRSRPLRTRFDCRAHASISVKAIRTGLLDLVLGNKRRIFRANYGQLHASRNPAVNLGNNLKRCTYQSTHITLRPEMNQRRQGARRIRDVQKLADAIYKSIPRNRDLLLLARIDIRNFNFDRAFIELCQHCFEFRDKIRKSRVAILVRRTIGEQSI